MYGATYLSSKIWDSVCLLVLEWGGSTDQTRPCKIVMQQLEMTNVFVCEISQDRSSEKTPFEQSIFITTINVKNNHTHVQNGPCTWLLTLLFLHPRLLLWLQMIWGFIKTFKKRENMKRYVKFCSQLTKTQYSLASKCWSCEKNCSTSDDAVAPHWKGKRLKSSSAAYNAHLQGSHSCRWRREEVGGNQNRCCR